MKLENQGFLLCYNTSTSIVVQKFDFAGKEVGEAYAIDDVWQWFDQFPSLCRSKDGRLLACWESYPYWDEKSEEVRCRLLSADGEPKTDVFRIAPLTNYELLAPAIAPLTDNYFIVAWASKYQNEKYDYDIFAQILRRDGVEYGKRMVLNDFRASAQQRPHACSINEKKYVVTWDSNDQDGFEQGVFAKILPAVPRALELQPFSITQPKTDDVVHTTSPRVVWTSPIKDVIYDCELTTRLYYSLDGDFTNYGVVTTRGDTTALLEKLQKGKLYYVKAVAENYNGEKLRSSNTVAFLVDFAATGEEMQGYQNQSDMVNCDWIDEGEWTWIDENSGEEDDEKEYLTPANFALYNAPNPFNNSTTVYFLLEYGGWIELDVYDLNGKKVARLLQEYKNSGLYHVSWRGRDSAGQQLPSGVYFLHLLQKGRDGSVIMKTKKMSLVR